MTAEAPTVASVFNTTGRTQPKVMVHKTAPLTRDDLIFMALRQGDENERLKARIAELESEREEIIRIVDKVHANLSEICATPKETNDNDQIT